MLTPETTALLVELAVTLLVALVGVILAAITPAIQRYVRSKVTEQQYETLESIASVAVNAAEQIYKNELGKGTEKRAYALEVMTNAMAKRGINLSPAELEAIIEAAVMKEFNFPEVVGQENTEVVAA